MENRYNENVRMDHRNILGAASKSGLDIAFTNQISVFGDFPIFHVSLWPATLFSHVQNVGGRAKVLFKSGLNVISSVAN